MMFPKVPYCIIGHHKTVSGVWLLFLCLSLVASQALAGVSSEDTCGCGMQHVLPMHAGHQLPSCCVGEAGHACCHLSKNQPLDTQETVSLLNSSQGRQVSFELAESEIETSFTLIFPQGGRISFIKPVARSAPLYLQYRTFLC